MGVGSLPLDENYHPVLGLKDDVSGNVYPVHIGSLVTGSDGKTYALLDTSATVTPAANQRVNTHAGDVAAGSFVSGSILAGALADGADVTQGTTTQTKATDGSATSWSVIQLLKGLVDKLVSGNLTVLPGNTANTTAWLASVNDGTTTANNLATSAGTGASGNAQLMAGGFREIAGAGTGTVTGTNTDYIPSFDMSAYAYGMLSLVGTFTATFTVQFSNDNFATQTTTGYCIKVSTGSEASTMTTPDMYYIPKLGRYMRVRCTAFTSNASLAGFLELYTFPLSSGALWSVGVGGTATVAGGKTNNNAAPSTNNVGVLPAIANAAVQTWTEGDQVLASTDLAGNVRVLNACATGAKTNVSSSASSVTILAANNARKGAMIFNDSTQVLYLDLTGGTASSTSYSVQLAANAFFELPVSIYTGLITGIWAIANGNARVTEFS